MGSGKKRTAMAKLDRERKRRERQVAKQERKDARRQAAAERAPSDGVPGALPLE
jgi:hypothetical protein